MSQGSEDHNAGTCEEPVELESLLGYQLKHLQSELRSTMDETLRPLELTTPQYNCLEQLRRRPGASNSELARGAFVTRQTMNTLVRALQERGLITRPATAESGRILPTRLTSAGVAVLDQAVTRVEAVSARMVSPLDDETRTIVTEALRRCIAALEGAEDG